VDQTSQRQHVTTADIMTTDTALTQIFFQHGRKAQVSVFFQDNLQLLVPTILQNYTRISVINVPSARLAKLPHKTLTEQHV